MRPFLIRFGWLSCPGGIIDAATALLLLVRFVALGGAPASLTVGDHLRDHRPALYWVRDVAAFVMPDPTVTALFALPVLVFFPLRIVLGLLIGAAAMEAAKRMPRS
jgi:hypothetical protein